MAFFGINPLGLAPTAVVVVVEALLLAIALVVAPRNRRPSSALAWILLVVVLPLAGLVLFLLIGSPKLPKARRDKQRRINDRIAEAVRAADPLPEHQEIPQWLPAMEALNRAGSALPFTDGNTARLLTTFDDQLAALVAAARSAQRFLHVEFYILSLDDTVAGLFQELEAAVQRGVSVRVLLDHLGSRGYPGYRRALRELDRIGAEWHLMLPVQPLRGRYQRPDLRNHRKLLVADGAVALVGSLNVIEPGYQRRRNHRRGLQWHDMLVEVRGPAVQEVDALFVTDWYSETDELLDTAERRGEGPVADEHRQLEIQLERADVHVGRSDDADQVVHRHVLRVQDAGCRVLVDADAGLQEHLVVGVLRMEHERLVADRPHEQLDGDPAA